VSVIDRLLDRLNRVFSRDPKIIPVITLARNAVYTSVVAADGNTYQLNIFSDNTQTISTVGYDDGSDVTYDDNTTVITAPDTSGDVPGDYRPVFQRFDVPAGKPTAIASSGCLYNLEVYDNGDGTWSHGFIRLPGSGTFGPAAFDAIDGNRYLLSFIDNGDGTWSDVYTRVFGQTGGLTPTTLTVKDLTLSIEADGQIPIDLSSGTLSDLVAVISTYTGFSASLVDPSKGDLLARGIYEVADQDLAQDQTLYYPTALLYNEIQVNAWALMDQSSRQQDAERQLCMNTAEQDWLDYWGNEYFDIPRYAGESDDAYSQRITHQILQASQNNVALEMIIKQSLGIDVSVVDAAKVLSELTTDEQAAAPGRIILENIGLDHSWLTDQQGQAVAQVEDIVNRYRAAGTAILKHLLVLLVQQTETITTVESMLATFILEFTDALQPGPIQVGAGWKVGTPGLKVGNNDPVKEQIVIKQISSLDGSVTAKYLYGG
jgi:hypothetical protein